MKIPRDNKDVFNICVGPPYGKDVVQAIACTDDSELHKKHKVMFAFFTHGRLTNFDEKATINRWFFGKANKIFANKRTFFQMQLKIEQRMKKTIDKNCHLKLFLKK